MPFGSYEVGRSKKPINQKPTAAFKDGMMKGVPLEPQGDPGAYDPYSNMDLVASASFTHNKTAKPFMATSSRELAMPPVSGPDRESRRAHPVSRPPLL